MEHLSNIIPESRIGEALNAGRDRRGNRAQRADGWTAARIEVFLRVLARTGAVAKAARAAGMSRQSAYALRGSSKGQAFDDAWRRALLAAAPCLADELMDRALNGSVEPIFRHGKLWAHSRRYDNAPSLRVLKELDRTAESKSPSARLLQSLADDFEALVEVVCSGDDDQFDAFLRSHAPDRRRNPQMPNLSTLPAKAEPAANVDQTPDLSTLVPAAESDEVSPTSRTGSTAAETCKPENLSTLTTQSGDTEGAGAPMTIVPQRRTAGWHGLPIPPHRLGPADHFASGMKLYRARSFFPPGREARGFFGCSAVRRPPDH